MGEFAVGTQRASGNGKRVTWGKPLLWDRYDRLRNCVLSCIVQSRKTGGSRLRRRYRGLEFVSWTYGSSGFLQSSESAGKTSDGKISTGSGGTKPASMVVSRSKPIRRAFASTVRSLDTC
jgi:hypothetical protein